MACAWRPGCGCGEGGQRALRRLATRCCAVGLAWGLAAGAAVIVSPGQAPAQTGSASHEPVPDGPKPDGPKPDGPKPDGPKLDGPGLFRERGCAQCHEIGGVGGHKGPDLSGVGRRLKQPAIRQQIVVGGDAMPAFGEALTQDEVTLLVKYLHHCKAKVPAWRKPALSPELPSASPDSQGG